MSPACQNCIMTMTARRVGQISVSYVNLIMSNLFIIPIVGKKAYIMINFVCNLKRETRKNYFDVWKKMLLAKNYQASTAVRQYVVLPHHGPNSGLEERVELSWFFLTFCFATPHTHEKLFLNFKIVWLKCVMRLR
jgi:hypothetical protein